MRRIYLLILILIVVQLGGAATSLAAQSSVDEQVLEAINSTVFEVVARKPADGAVTYARELPLDLIPFHIRTDEYISIGTAFAVARDRFLTAAHVLDLESPTLRADLYLRALDGRTYPIETIIRYDNHRDYALFTAAGLSVERPLRVDAEPALNTSVFAVGNAHGEGIIIRDGLLTSRTAERHDGEWSWLRYSAAASPGNSGGPLLSTTGEVLGLVTAKSESENLNFALPMSEIQPFDVGDAFVRFDFTYGLPHIQTRRRSSEETTIALPATLEEFRSAAVRYRESVLEESLIALLDENADQIFPADRDGQRAVLLSNPGSLFPLLVSEREDSTWQYLQPDEINSSEIADGSLRTGVIGGDTFFQIESQETDIVARTMADPRTILETILSGYRLTRNIASEEIPITSLGDPYQWDWTEDQWGRRWLYGLWEIPFADYGLVLYALPTPNGAVGMFAAVSRASVSAYFLDFASMINATYVSYFGTLGQWESFLNQRQWLPEFLYEASFGYEPGSTLAFGTNRFSIEFGNELLPITEDSSLYLLGSFKPSADRVELGVSGLYFYATRSRADRLSAVQNFPPAAANDSDTLQTWETILNERHPYNASSLLSGGDTHVLAPVPGQQLTQESNSVWTIGLSLAGDVPSQTMSNRFELLEKAVVIGNQEKTDLTGELSFVRPIALAHRPVRSLAEMPADQMEPAQLLAGFTERAPLPDPENIPNGDVTPDSAAQITRPDLGRQDGKTAVYRALEERNIETAEHLVATGAPLGTVTEDGYTELLLALRIGAEDAAELIIRRRPPVFERTTADGESALMLAARYSQELVPVLLSLGGSANLRSNDGNTPLHFAVLGGDELTVLRLLRAGADPDEANASGVTPRTLVEEAGREIQLVFENY